MAISRPLFPSQVIQQLFVGYPEYRSQVDSIYQFSSDLPLKKEKIPCIMENFRTREIFSQDYFNFFKKKEGAIDSQSYLVIFSKFGGVYEPDKSCAKLNLLTTQHNAFFRDAHWSFNIFYSPDAKKKLSKEGHLAILAFDFGPNYLSEPILYPLVKQIQSKPIDSSSAWSKELFGKIDQRNVQGFYDLTQNVRWEKMLLQMFIDWSKETGFEKVLVQSAVNNTYCKPTKFDSDLRREERAVLEKRLFLRYDVAAKRMGFKYDPSSGNYFLDFNA